VKQAELERARQLFENAVRALLPGTAIDRIELLQYGDAPEIEPGELLGRIILSLPDGADPADVNVRRGTMTAFEQANPGKMVEQAKAFGTRKFAAGLFASDGPDDNPDRRGPAIRLTMKPGARFPLFDPSGPGGPGGLSGEQPLTAVMARLDAADLETLDTLIGAGIASSRAEGVRWALARIRERPAFDLLRAHAREIEDLKSQF
jgi:hypothetical protein